MMIDHLVFAGPDLDDASALVERILGVSTVPGGQHVGVGTRNRLVGLGGSTYLEIIGPDPDQEEPALPRPFEIDDLDEARLVAWAVSVPEISEARRQVGEQLVGQGSSLSRMTPSGGVLAWEVTPTLPGAIPFLIDWLDTVHPTTSLDHKIELVALRVETPDPEPVRTAVRALGVTVEVRKAREVRLAATIDLPDRRVVLW